MLGKNGKYWLLFLGYALFRTLTERKTSQQSESAGNVARLIESQEIFN